MRMIWDASGGDCWRVNGIGGASERPAMLRYETPEISDRIEHAFRLWRFQSEALMQNAQYLLNRAVPSNANSPFAVIIEQDHGLPNFPALEREMGGFFGREPKAAQNIRAFEHLACIRHNQFQCFVQCGHSRFIIGSV